MSELLREQDEKTKRWANQRFHGSCRRLSHARGHITACLPACDGEAVQRTARRGKLAAVQSAACACVYACWILSVGVVDLRLPPAVGWLESYQKKKGKKWTGT